MPGSLLVSGIFDWKSRLSEVADKSKQNSGASFPSSTFSRERDHTTNPFTQLGSYNTLKSSRHTNNQS